MPTYEYACSQCGHKFEEFKSILSEPARECPQCAGRVERVINGGIGLIFKGSGFYLTDYKKKANTSDAAADGGEAAKPEKSGAKKETTTTEKAVDKTSGDAAKS